MKKATLALLAVLAMSIMSCSEEEIKPQESGGKTISANRF